MDTQLNSQDIVTPVPAEVTPKLQTTTLVRFIRIFLLVLIVVGIGLLCTINLWVPKLVSAILGTVAPIQSQNLVSASTTTQEIAVTTHSTPSNVSAAIDPSSLIATSSTPTITGTFSTVEDVALEIVIVKGETSLPATGSQTVLPPGPGGAEIDENQISGIVYQDETDHGGMMGFDQVPSVPVKNDHFYDMVSTSLPDGTYTVGIYTYQNIYTDHYVGDTPHTLLASGRLIVKS